MTGLLWLASAVVAAYALWRYWKADGITEARWLIVFHAALLASIAVRIPNDVGWFSAVFAGYLIGRLMDEVSDYLTFDARQAKARRERVLLDENHQLRLEILRLLRANAGFRRLHEQEKRGWS